MIKRFYVSIIVLVFMTVTAYAHEEPPKQFMTKEDAVKSSCQLQSLKDKNKENCVINDFDGHHLKITIYDRNPNGEFERSNHLTITSWYQEAKISYEDLLGKGIKFMRIEFEGNTGTGTLQKIVSYWGWHDDKFVPVFFETTSYYTSGRYLEELKMNYEFNNKGSKQPSTVLKYYYSNSNPKHKAKYKWRETLHWQADGFSFYNLKEEEKKLDRPCSGRLQIQKTSPLFAEVISFEMNERGQVYKGVMNRYTLPRTHLAKKLLKELSSIFFGNYYAAMGDDSIVY